MLNNHLEFGEWWAISVFIADFVWHHQIIDEIKAEDDHLSEVENKIDALISVSPAAREFLRLQALDGEDSNELIDKVFSVPSENP